jgi:hypothetical protein
MSILTHDSTTALWHKVVLEAEQSCSIALQEEIESYLVFLLMRYLDKPEWVKQIVALEFLEGVTLAPLKREFALRDVGDKCLLFAGLFPNIAKTRLVRLSYFVKMGQASYFGVSRKSNDLYDHLSNQFVSLMDVLQSIRQHPKTPDLLPLEAYELWNDTGSQRALIMLKQYTNHPQAMPIGVKK